MVPQPALLEPLRRWDPEQINGFALIGRLGAGSMGRVYLGRSAAGRLVAVKTIKIELADEPHFRTRFAQEVAAARRVSGAFTAAVVAADPEADLPWLATTYVPAPSLSKLVRACGPLPVQAVKWLGAGCAEALESIHGAGLVHRDLKPSNVLVSTDGPRVIDFGIARAAERIQLTLSRGAVGTPAYMAPEQARDTRQASLASDVFSLGATMLFAATGHAPYRGDTVMDVLVQLATDAPDLTGLPYELADVVSACLQRDPRRRPTSASVLAYLAPGTGGEGRELGPGALPDPALAFIAQYRRDPRPSAEPAAEDSGDEETFGSHPVLSMPRRAAASSRPQGRWADRRDDKAGPGHRRSGPRTRRTALLVTAAVTATLLVAGAAAVGASLAARPGGTGTNAGAGRPSSTTGTTADRSAGGGTSNPASTASGGTSGPDGTGRTYHSGSGHGNVAIGVAVRPGRRPPPPPPAGGGQGQGPGQGPPATLTLSPAVGSGNTDFVLTGQRWPHGLPVTLTLEGASAPAQRVWVDGLGNFSCTIRKDHGLFRGRIPDGNYQLLVTGTGGGPQTVVSFSVR